MNYFLKLCSHTKQYLWNHRFGGLVVVVQSLVMSDSLRAHGLQLARLPSPSPSPRVCSNSCPLSWWCYVTLLSSTTSFSFCPNESALCIRWPKYWSFSINPSSEYSGLISLRIDWYDLDVQGTLKNLLQNHSSKASVLQCSDFFVVQHSHPYNY